MTTATIIKIMIRVVDIVSLGLVGPVGSLVSVGLADSVESPSSLLP